MTLPLIWLKLLYGMRIDLYACFRIATVPTLKVIWKEPSLLLKPREISRVFMNFVWEPFGDGFDEASREEKEKLVTPWASGVVFEIGAAHGHLAKYLDRKRVTAYVALEPNVNMHERLRAKTRESGFDETEGSFLLLPYGIEEIDKIGIALEGWARKWGRDSTDGRVVDTIVSILTLCSVPARPSSAPSSPPPSFISTPPADTIRALHSRILRPGGQLLFYEHVRSPIPAFARGQDLLAPLWRSFFDGCVIGVDSVRAIWEAGFEGDDFCSGLAPDLKRGYDEWIEEAGIKTWKPLNEKGGGWARMNTWGKKGEDPETLFFHQLGRCVKRSS
ncbi:hypothetical protein ACEPAH_9477 [Sanghuangporus vaninii]